MENLTSDERGCLERLVQAWSAFIKLPVQHKDDHDEFKRAIHAAQNVVLARPAARETTQKDFVITFDE